MNEDLRDLGWANKGGETYARINEAVIRCRDLGHVSTDIDVGPPNRGIEPVVSC